MKKIAKRYTGPLNEAEIAEGIACVRANVEQIIIAAKSLADLGINALSCAWSILAIEESMKVQVLRNLNLCDPNDSIAIKALWKDFRTHRQKHYNLAVALASEALVNGEIPPDDDAIERKIAQCPDPDMLEELKQGLIYCDCLETENGRPSWSVPVDWAVPATDVQRFLGYAHDALDRIGINSPEELRIWKKHMSPNRLKPVKEQLEIVETCVAELRELGLWSSS